MHFLSQSPKLRGTVRARETPPTTTPTPKPVYAALRLPHTPMVATHSDGPEAASVGSGNRSVYLRAWTLCRPMSELGRRSFAARRCGRGPARLAWSAVLLQAAEQSSGCGSVRDGPRGCRRSGVIVRLGQCSDDHRGATLTATEARSQYGVRRLCMCPRCCCALCYEEYNEVQMHDEAAVSPTAFHALRTASPANGADATFERPQIWLRTPARRPTSRRP